VLEFYADQTGTGSLTILGGVMIATEDLHSVMQELMDFKVAHGLRATSPVKTADWKEDQRYRDMQKLPNVSEFLTDCCEFVAGNARLLVLVCVVDMAERDLTQDEANYFLIQNTAKRLQFEVQDRTGERPSGPSNEWSMAQPPRKKKGIQGRMVVDHPGSKQEAKWSKDYSTIYKAFARPYTHLLHLSPELSFAHGRSSPLIQLADVVVGAVRLYLRGQSRKRFEMLLPRFRTDRGGRVDGYGLVFDPKPGAVWQRFKADYAGLATSVKRASHRRQE